MTRVLIVEDQPELGRLVAAALTEEGYEVRVAATAGAGRTALEAWKPGVLVLDLLLPDALGFSLAECAAEAASPPKVIAVSGAFRGDRMVESALASGALSAFFPKPFRLSELLETLKRLAPIPPRPPASTSPPSPLTDATVEGTTQDYLFDSPEEGLAGVVRATTEGTFVPPAPTSVTSGTLQERSVPRLITAFYASGETGELHLMRGKVRKVIYFVEGRPVFAASNLRRDRFDELLLRSGFLQADAVRRIAEAAVDRGERVDRALLQAGLIDARRHARLLRQQIKEILFSLFGWSTGTWRMTFGGLGREEAVALDVFPGTLVLEGVRALPLDHLKDKVPGTMRFAPAPAPAYELYDLDLSDAEALLLSRLDGTRSVDELVEEGWLEPKETRALLYGLWSLEVIEDASLLLL
ncbi:MAG: response regulator [Deltaproteobacteria bacterium]|nr:MAG: response regulator [Deltaproteobacteria bacterium]